VVLRPGRAELLVRAGKSDKLFRITLEVEQEEPHRITGLMVSPEGAQVVPRY